MSSKDIAIKVNHLSKSFKLPHEKNSTVKGIFLGGFRKSKAYEIQKVLQDITFEVGRGEFIGIVGRNGSGKSTLLKILGEIYQPTSGRVEVSGSLTPFIELGIGFNPELTGRDNVFLNGAILGLTRKEISERYDSIVEFAELEKFMDKKLKNYSSGMQVRLAFSISMEAHNDILLIDEVLAVGDASFQRKCFEVFKGMKQSGKTVVFVTHDMGAVRDYCDRAILIESGKIVSQGDPNNVANDYLQMFNEEASKRQGSVGARWGDGKAIIQKAKVSVGAKSIEVEYELMAKEQIDNPIAGVIIKDLDNHHLYDSNTKWKKASLGIIKKDNSRKLQWTVPNIFKTGQYKVTLAVAHSDGLGFYDWQDDALVFHIARDETTAGLVVLDDKIIISE